MTSFSEFDRSFQEARGRASPNPGPKRLNGRTENKSASKNQFSAFDSTGVALSDFQAFMPMHTYIYTPSREMWPASSVNARLPPISLPSGKNISPGLWLDRHRPVEQMTWAPGLPMLICNRLISEGGWIERNGVTCTLPAAHHQTRRSERGRSLAHSCAQSLPRRCPAHHKVACPPGAATCRKGEPRPGARRQAGNWQRHIARAGEASDWSMELLGSFTAASAWQIQWFSEVRNPSGQRGA
jgi:hypothetical protein